MDGIKARFELLQILLRVAEPVQTVAQLLRSVLRRIHEIGNALMQRGCALVHALHARQSLLCAGQELCRAGRAFVAVERGECALQRVCDLFGVLQHAAARFQLRILPGCERRALDLVDLVLQRLDQPELFALVHGKALDLLCQLLHAGIFFPVFLQQPAVMRKQIKIGKVARLVEKLLRIVLAVDADELDAEPLQNGDRDRPAVHAADVFPVGIDLTLDEKLVRIVFDLIFPEPRKLGNTGKDGADKRTRRAGPDDVTVRPLAENGGNGIDHDGFACAGLAGQHIEAAVKADLRLLDHGDILNVQHIQHN